MHQNLDILTYLDVHADYFNIEHLLNIDEIKKQGHVNTIKVHTFLYLCIPFFSAITTTTTTKTITTATTTTTTTTTTGCNYISLA